MPAMGTMPAKLKRNVTIANSSIAGKTYREMEKIHGVSKATISRVLNREEIKEIVDQGLIEVIARVPRAINTIDKVFNDYKDNPALAYKASEFTLKTATIAPSNVENQTINNIVNVQNNITLNPSVAKMMTGAFNNNDEDIAEAEINA